MHIINAEEQHIPAIRRIYAHHVLHGTGSFETAPPNTQEMLARVKNVQSRGFRKRAARTVLTGMCYSVGSATRQGSSSLTRFIGQSAITSSTWRR